MSTMLTPEQKAIADAALRRMNSLRTCSIRAMTAMGKLLKEQGETQHRLLSAAQHLEGGPIVVGGGYLVLL